MFPTVLSEEWVSHVSEQNNFNIADTKQTGLAWTLWTHIWETHGLNLCMDISYANIFMTFLSLAKQIT